MFVTILPMSASTNVHIYQCLLRPMSAPPQKGLKHWPMDSQNRSRGVSDLPPFLSRRGGRPGPNVIKLFTAVSYAFS